MSPGYAVVLAVLLVGASSLPCVAATIRVPADQPTLQAAVDAAAPGDTVLAAPGTYRGTGNTEIDPHGKDLVIRSETGAEATIIDGEGSSSNPRRAFYLHAAETSATVIEGFTINHCWGLIDGGAMYLRGTSPTVRHCRFADNVAYGHDYDRGGAVNCGPGSSPSFEDCEFTGNGGASAYSYGGAAYLDAATVSFTRCTFDQNQSRVGGAIWWRNCTLSFVDCRFTQNLVNDTGGGAIYGYGGPLTALRCEFRQNQATEPLVSRGGGLYLGIASSQYAFTDCVFADNLAGWSGGAMNISSDVSLDGCIFVGNEALTSGGALGHDSGTLRITGCTFAGNTSPAGSALSVRSTSTVEAARSIVAFGLGSPALYCATAPSLTISCCDVFGNEGGDWTGCLAGLDLLPGNFARDPEFCGAETGDLTLRATSPCLPGQHPEGTDCQLIGARSLGCGATSTESMTWGAARALFR